MHLEFLEINAVIRNLKNAIHSWADSDENISMLFKKFIYDIFLNNLTAKLKIVICVMSVCCS